MQDVISATVTSGGYSAADAVIITRTGTPATGVQITSFTGSPTALAAGQSSILTVTITNSSGAPVSGQTVNFGFAILNSGATLTTINGATGTTATGVTDASGKAVAVYTAGSTTPALSLEDILIASCGNSATALIITRTASTSLSVTLSVPVTSLKAGQSSIITAIVTEQLRRFRQRPDCEFWIRAKK